MEWHSKSVKETLAELKTSDNGLSESEAAARIEKYGRNELKEGEKKSALRMFLEQFTDVLIVILIIAAVVSGAVLNELVDAAAILAVVVLSAVFGFVQEYKAEKAVQALKRMLAPKTRVLRGGVEKQIDAKDLVPGDVVFLEEGEKVPADCRLVEVFSLEADEAALTGESLPVAKDAGVKLSETAPLAERKNMVFMGTVVTRGRGKAVVVKTGMQTQMGLIAELVSEQEAGETPLQKKLAVLGKQLGLAALVIVALIFAVGVFVQHTPLVEMFLIAVSLAVAAIPESLPAIVTVTLALGVQRMAKRNAIVRKLPAVETLGAATVICSDKTGTLTKNEMTVRKIVSRNKSVEVTGEGYEFNGGFTEDGRKMNPLNDEALYTVLKAGVLCNNSSIERKGGKNAVLGDPTEGCLLVAAEKSGLNVKEMRADAGVVDELPFDSQRKMMTVVRFDAGKRIAYAKGAIESVLAKSTRVLDGKGVRKITDEDKKWFLEKNEEMASQALRVLAFAFREAKESEKELEKDLVFAGLAGMIDAPRPEAIEAVKAAKAAGIRVVMITGDNKITAVAIAKEMGIMRKGDVVVEGVELNALSENELRDLIEDVRVFARVSPEHKLRIVNALKAQGHVVAMTGDGVNDAPAIKRADIGVAMGITGTDVTKEASEMVVVDDNFASIVSAIEEGRTIYDNIRKSVTYLVSCNVGELMTIFAAIMMGMRSPLMPIQILWMNLVTDGLPAIALGMEPAEANAMKRPPRNTREEIINKKSLMRMVFIGLVMAVGTLAAFSWAQIESGSYERAVSMAFVTIIFFQLFFALSSRSDEPLFKHGLFSNKMIWLAVGGAVLLQIAVVQIGFLQPIFKTVSLNALEWGVAIAIASTAFWLDELLKLLSARKKQVF